MGRGSRSRCTRRSRTSGRIRRATCISSIGTPMRPCGSRAARGATGAPRGRRTAHGWRSCPIGSPLPTSSRTRWPSARSRCSPRTCMVRRRRSRGHTRAIACWCSRPTPAATAWTGAPEPCAAPNPRPTPLWLSPAGPAGASSRSTSRPATSPRSGRLARACGSSWGTPTTSWSRSSRRVRARPGGIARSSPGSTSPSAPRRPCTGRHGRSRGSRSRRTDGGRPSWRATRATRGC